MTKRLKLLASGEHIRMSTPSPTSVSSNYLLPANLLLVQPPQAPPSMALPTTAPTIALPGKRSRMSTTNPTPKPSTTTTTKTTHKTLVVRNNDHYETNTATTTTNPHNTNKNQHILDTLTKAKYDTSIQEIHFLFITFTPIITKALIELLYYDTSRIWKTILFVRCRLVVSTVVSPSQSLSSLPTQPGTTTTTRSTRMAEEEEEEDNDDSYDDDDDDELEQEDEYPPSSSVEEIVEEEEMSCSFLMPVLVNRVEQLVWNQTSTYFGPSSIMDCHSNGSSNNCTSSNSWDAHATFMSGKNQHDLAGIPIRMTNNALHHHHNHQNQIMTTLPSFPSLTNMQSVMTMMMPMGDRLKYLVIRQTNLSTVEAFSLGKAISQNNSLQELDLRTTKIDTDAAEALSKGLLSCCGMGTKKDDSTSSSSSSSSSSTMMMISSLKHIDLSHCKLTDVGASTLVHTLTRGASSSTSTSSQSQLLFRVSSLKLCGNKIGPLCVIALAEHLNHPETTMEQLDLSSSQMPVSTRTYNNLSSSTQQESIVRIPNTRTRITSVTNHHHHRGGNSNGRNYSMNRIIEPPKFGLCNISVLAKAIGTNTTLRTLNLARNALHQQDAIDLSYALIQPTQTTLQELNLSFNHISDNGIVHGFGKYLPQMLGLQRLALTPNPMTAKLGGASLLHGLQTNYRLEYLDSLISLQSPKLSNSIRYLTHLNRGGRRILHVSPSDINDIPISLWSTILGRVNDISYLSTDCSDEKNRMDVMYHLLTNSGPTLFSMATSPKSK